MPTKLIKTGLIALTWIGAATLTISCSPNSNQSQASNTQVTETSNKQEIKQTGDMMENGHESHDMSMDLGPADADYDLRFIDGMLMHHQGAVNMAEDALSKSQRPEIKKLAQDIIAAQNREISQMKEWRTAWYPKADSTPMAYHSQMGHTMAMTDEQKQAMMMSMDLGTGDAEFDLRFINAMVPHHEGALVMAEDALSKSQRPEVKKLAQDILTSQQQEIEQMNQWRKDWSKQ
ncbi:MAG: DUF305 domain-containing protein [Pleurocapsa minor HA4230-MV1]|jgi:uncharacterized protein (DUF305 family)|nr:DUF305 domain-containing protein [Pleurocapsa minor HA4230-MV1]